MIYHNHIPLNHTLTLYTMIICTITSIPGVYRKIVTLKSSSFIYIFKHVCSLQEHSSDRLIPPVTARGHHPSGGSLLRRQRGVAMQPRTTDCGLHVQYTIPKYNIRIYTYNCPIATLLLYCVYICYHSSTAHLKYSKYMLPFINLSSKVQ